MKNFSITVLAASAVLFSAVSAHAFTVDLDGTRAIGIRNLPVDPDGPDLPLPAVPFDIVFEFVRADSAGEVACLPNVPCDIFFADIFPNDTVRELAAEAAQDAINAAMNGWTPFPLSVGSGPDGVTGNISYFVPWDKSGGQVNVSSAQATVVNQMTWLRIGDADLDGDDMVEYARLRPSVIPVPAAVWLFGSALGILGWVRRRTRAAAVG